MLLGQKVCRGKRFVENDEVGAVTESLEAAFGHPASKSEEIETVEHFFRGHLSNSTVYYFDRIIHIIRGRF